MRKFRVRHRNGLTKTYKGSSLMEVLGSIENAETVVRIEEVN